MPRAGRTFGSFWSLSTPSSVRIALRSGERQRAEVGTFRRSNRHRLAGARRYKK